MAKNTDLSDLDSQQAIERAFEKSNDALRVTQIGGTGDPSYDYIKVTYPTATTEVYTYKTGGAGGATVKTVTLTYTDATKANLDTVVVS